MAKKCDCGDGSVEYHPWENQWEPACWYCFYHPMDEYEREEQERLEAEVREEAELIMVAKAAEDELPF
jgi:hypothetical protein